MKPYCCRLCLIFIVVLICFDFATAQKVVVKKTAPVAKKTVAIAISSNVKNFENGINLKIKGFKVKEAYLIFDDGVKVPVDNTAEINQNVNMRIVLDGGFKAVDGKAFPGASEKIMLSNGYVVLQEEDLFKAYDETGVSPDDANYITLKAVITAIKDKTKHVIVSFKVWDKKSALNEITGSYKLYIK